MAIVIYNIPVFAGNVNSNTKVFQISKDGQYIEFQVQSAYSMVVKVYKGGSYVTYTVDDIDITGNVYDLTYIQPLK